MQDLDNKSSSNRKTFLCFDSMDMVLGQSAINCGERTVLQSETLFPGSDTQENKVSCLVLVYLWSLKESLWVIS